MKKINTGALIIALLIPLLTGMLSAALTAEGMAAYKTMNKPPLAPPAWLFPVAWTILYLMMGLSSYYIAVSSAEGKFMLLLLYALHLALNFWWSIIFFNLENFLLAFLCLITMLCIVILCAVRFFPISRIASLLLIPYVLWLIFAAYLNMGAYILN